VAEAFFQQPQAYQKFGYRPPNQEETDYYRIWKYHRQFKKIPPPGLHQKPNRNPAKRVRVGKEEQRSGAQFQGGPKRDRLETEWSGFRSDVAQRVGFEPTCSVTCKL